MNARTPYRLTRLAAMSLGHHLDHPIGRNPSRRSERVVGVSLQRPSPRLVFVPASVLVSNDSAVGGARGA
jgi:hypothetical protein